MSVHRIVNAIKQAAESLDASVARPMFGIVQSYNPNLHAVKLLMQPDQVLTGWVPIITPLSGTGWGVSIPPMLGQQVAVIHQGGDSSCPIVVGSVYSDSALPPVANSINSGGTATHASTGEVLLVNQSGATIRLCADGSAYLQATAFNVSAPVNIRGNVQVTGTITASGDITAGSISLEQHEHGQVQPGSGESGPPLGGAGSGGSGGTA